MSNLPCILLFEMLSRYASVNLLGFNFKTVSAFSPDEDCGWGRAERPVSLVTAVPLIKAAA